MTEPTHEIPVPQACSRWCAAQPHGLTVLDDFSTIDLDWWNNQLRSHEIPVILRGRNPDGGIFTTGEAHLRRGDLVRGSELCETQWSDLGLLYLCAAWVMQNKARSTVRRFPDVRELSPPSQIRTRPAPLQRILDSLRYLDKSADLSKNDFPIRRRGGWPPMPGIGIAPLSVYLWATKGMPVIDQDGVSTLIHEGWIENPAIHAFTVTRYRRYHSILSSWAKQCDTSVDLVELWLVRQWQERYRSLAERSRTPKL